VFSPRTMPAELLVYMVDPGAQLDELAWALDGYGGQREIGPRYAEIKYDNDHFERGKEKKVSAEGFTLQNIKRYGGICADQAHFASTVGKAVGVPAVVDAGQGQGVAHAWLGFLKVTTRGAEWNFDAGRYAEYEGVRGSVTDPQTDAPIPDGTLALTAETLNVAERVRWASTAMVDGARRLAKLAGAPVTAGLELPVTGLTRTSAPADRLALLKSSLTLFSANPRAWNALRAMAADKELTLDQKKEWAGALQTMCGDRYPDFTLAILAPMVETIDDTGQQGAVWEALFRRWRGPRPDLAAEVLIEQGNMWDKAGDPARAYYSYTAAAYQFLTKSPSAVEALDLCEALLKKRNAGHQVLPMYAQAWKRLTKPDNAAQEFLMQSNWYRVGSRYCDLLEEDGQVNKADQVRKSLGEDDRSIARREKQRAPNR
ncbi:MAG: hypothetical protein K2Q09_12150, partial [Phycisphaerales bacterium]|nr:hypothetical protein [Phycisphaerales bacterium]